MRDRYPCHGGSLWRDGVLPFAALLIVLAMLTSGCGLLGAAEDKMDDAAEAIRAAAIVADRAEPHLALEYERALAECRDDVATVDACTKQVRESYAVVRDALATVRAVRCLSEPGACE